MGQSTQPDISYLVHKYARFYEDIRKPHGKDVIRIGRYLKGTEKWAYISALRKSDVKVWADADFRSNWFPEEAKDYSDTACSCLVFVV